MKLWNTSMDLLSEANVGCNHKAIRSINYVTGGMLLCFTTEDSWHAGDLAIGTDECEVIALNANAGPATTIQHAFVGDVCALAAHPKALCFAVGAKTGNVRLWDASACRLAGECSLPASCRHVFSRRMHFLIVAERCAFPLKMGHCLRVV